jgi:hypothetical protein
VVVCGGVWLLAGLICGRGGRGRGQGGIEKVECLRCSRRGHLAKDQRAAAHRARIQCGDEVGLVENGCAHSRRPPLTEGELLREHLASSPGDGERSKKRKEKQEEEERRTPTAQGRAPRRVNSTPHTSSEQQTSNTRATREQAPSITRVLTSERQKKNISRVHTESCKSTSIRQWVWCVW